MITPVALTVTTPLGTGIVCAVPGVNGVPLTDTIVKVFPSTSVSFANGVITIGVSSFVVSPLPFYQDEGVEEFFASESVPFLKLDEFFAGAATFTSFFVFNDWDKSVANPIINYLKRKGVATIGLIEGINDYNDVDTGRVRNAYRSVEYVLAPGSFEVEKYFRDINEKCFVVGIPRLKEIQLYPRVGEKCRKVIINGNFTYGVLEEFRDIWIADVVKACVDAGLDYTISVHRADRGDYSKYNVSTMSFYELLPESDLLISRFSTCIIEALIAGLDCVYYNPGFEKVDKFNDPLGAYCYPKTYSALKEVLDVFKPGATRNRDVSEFLELHTAIGQDSVAEIGKSIQKIICSRTPHSGANDDLRQLISTFKVRA